MKKRFLLIPVLAAVMLSTSCSKDDNNVDTKEVNNQTEVEKTNSITITAKKKSSISKVALGGKNTAENKYEEVFSQGDVLSLFLPEATEPFTTLTLSEGGAGKTTATFVGGEMPADANGKTITAKIIPSATPSGLQGCGSLEDAVSTYASLKGTFEYDNTQSTFSVNLDDEVSYFVIETNIENVDINGGNVDSRVFAFNTNQNVSSTALGLPEQELVAGGRVYVKNKYMVESITLNKTSTETTVGGEETLSVTNVLPSNATDKTVTWSSSNNNIATVDQNGKVKAVAYGTVKITATANDGSGVKAECEVTVGAEFTISFNWFDENIVLGFATNDFQDFQVTSNNISESADPEYSYDEDMNFGGNPWNEFHISGNSSSSVELEVYFADLAAQGMKFTFNFNEHTYSVKKFGHCGDNCGFISISISEQEDVQFTEVDN